MKKFVIFIKNQRDENEQKLKINFFTALKYIWDRKLFDESFLGVDKMARCYFSIKFKRQK